MTARMNEDAARPGQRSCPICGKPSVVETRPFCSRRCAHIDLGRWLKGVYAIPARPAEESETEGEAKEDRPKLSSSHDDQ
jgi:endogenous inhibitor of DNA gyrase (YacG/DUF329 family)